MLCGARFLGGASDNIFGAAKTLLSESMEEEHQAKGMALLGSSWGFAVIVGPAVGGLLSQPALKYPAVFSATGLFGVYPYLLPCCFTAGMALVAAVLLQAVPEVVGSRSAVATRIDCDAGAHSTPSVTDMGMLSCAMRPSPIPRARGGVAVLLKTTVGWLVGDSDRSEA